MAKFHTRTLRISISLKAFSQEKKNDAWGKIYQIMGDGWRAANFIVTGQYLNDAMMRSIYSRRGIDVKNLDAVKKIETEFKCFFGVGRQATTEKDIKKRFPDLPSCVTNTLNQIVFANYKKDKPDVLMGKRSLRSYGSNMPVPVVKKSIIFSRDADKHIITWRLRRGENLDFEIFYGRDRGGYKDSIEKILNSELDFSAPQFQIKKNKLFILLPVKDPEIRVNLIPDLSVGVDLGISIPAYVALSSGPQRKGIGSIKDFLRVRTQMQSRRRQLQKSLDMIRGGHGRDRKMRAMDRLTKKERNFARSYNHSISRKIIDFAVKNKASKIKIEMLEGFKSEEKNNFILRNWSYFELQQFISYKAKRFGIEVLKIDPYHTSQTCSKCGNYENGQRLEQSKFKCLSCGNEMNADHNAAINIAQSKKIVRKRSECEYNKKQSKRWGTMPEGEAISTH